MDAIWLGDQIKSGLTHDWLKVGWLKIASGYQHSVLIPIRFGFNAISRITGPYGAYAALGGVAIGLYYLGHSIWHMKMRPRVEQQEGQAVVVERGPKSRLLQVMMRIAGLFEMVIASAITGGLIAIAGGSTPLAIGVTGGITLLGMFV